MAALDLTRVHSSRATRSFQEPAAAVFDLDGTLVDSVDDICLAVNMVRSAHGFLPVEREYIRPLVGLPAEALFPDLDEPLARVTEFRAVLSEVSGTHTRIMTGAVALLTALRATGWRLAVATNKPTDLACTVLERAELAHFFEVIQGADGLAPKPDPATILEALRRLDTDKGIMVGDTQMDVLAGRAAGLVTVAVAGGSCDETALAFSQPDVLAAGGLSDLLALVL